MRHNLADRSTVRINGAMVSMYPEFTGCCGQRQ